MVSNMNMKESILETIIDSIVNIKLPDFDIVESSISSPYIMDKENNTCGIDVKIILKEKDK